MFIRISGTSLDDRETRDLPRTRAKVCFLSNIPVFSVGEKIDLRYGLRKVLKEEE